MSNFKEQLKVVQKEVRQVESQQKRNQKKYEQCDDISFVADVRSQHYALSFGGTAPLTKNGKAWSFAAKSKDLDVMIEDGHKYDRIFITRQPALSQATLEKIVSVLDPSGLLCFIGEDEAQRAAFAESIGDLYPQADIWLAESNMGPVVMTNAYQQLWSGRLN